MQFLRPTTLLLSLLGILPFYNATTKTFKPNVLYSIFLITFDIAALLYGIYKVIRFNDDKADLFLIGPFILGSTLHAFIVYWFTLRKAKVLQSMVDIVSIVDKGLAVKKSFAILTFTATNASFWPFIVDTILQPVNVPLQLFLLQLFQCYAGVMLPWMTYCLLSAVQIRFSKLNSLILDTKATCTSEVIRKINKLSKLHVDLCDLVDILNDVFGWFFFYFFLASFCCIITVIIYLRYQSDFSFATCFRNGIVISGILFQEILIAYTSEHIAREGVKFVTNSHRSMVHYEKFDQIKNEFRMLAQQGHVRSPVVSAAGFFNINYAMLYMLANVVATYVVVVIQLQI